MSSSTLVVWDQAFTAYNFGPQHPMAPLRCDLTMRLANDLGVLSHAGVTVSSAPAADDDLLTLVHTPEYVAAVRRVGAGDTGMDLSHGLGTDDNPSFLGMHDASAAVVGGTVAAARAVWSGEHEHAVNIAGGLHHAMPNAASGFCVYNDIGVAIADLLRSGVQRVAYVDVDVHHGDGVERMFWDDPRVLTISLHESGRALFPGTGWATDTGGPGAEGAAVNVPLPPGTGDQGWLRAFHSVVPQLLEEFKPEVLVTQQGADAHFLDPLAHLTLSLDGQRMAYQALHSFAHRYAGGRWVAVGGGGYEIVDVVPRAWTHLLAEASGYALDPLTPVPEGWREHVLEMLGRVAPKRMTDGRNPTVRDWSSGYDPADWVDKAILATRNAVFPAHGLDPMMDL